MKRRIFLVFFFTVFFRLQIYEAIAAVFWQSASYALYRANYMRHTVLDLTVRNGGDVMVTPADTRITGDPLRIGTLQAEEEQESITLLPTAVLLKWTRIETAD